MRWSAKRRGTGRTYATVRLSRKEQGPARAVRALIDTGAFYTMVPAGVLAALGVTPRWREEFGLADGRTIPREVGKAYVHHRGESAETYVIFGERGDAVVLGAYALEGLRVEVDPMTKRLRRPKLVPLIRLAPVMG